jgi:hypothetical protein
MIIMCIMLSACANIFKSEQPVKVGEYYPRRVENLEQILNEIEARNNSIEKHPAWISSATRDFMLKNLDELSESDYPGYRKYLDDGILYIIVHPAYSVFFGDQEPYLFTENPVDTFLRETAFTKEKRFLQEQERSLRDFMEITSTRQHLILVVLPGDYKNYPGYVYRNLSNAYARYINSVTNSSESVIYLYSEKPNKGDLPEQSEKHLLKFIESVNPETILIGGSYLGRCVEDFYKEISASIGEKKIAIAAEITAISRDDLQNHNIDIGDLLKDGKLNIAMLKEVITSKSMKGSSLKDFLRNYKNYRTNKR